MFPPPVSPSPASWTVVVPERLACDVFVGCMPLRAPALAPRGVPAILKQLGVQHFYTVVQKPSAGECLYFDFLPANPENPFVIAAALLGQRVSGVVQERKLQRPPGRSCWWVGKTEHGKGFNNAIEFNREWDSRLLLFQHDCRHHTDGLVQHLTGKKGVTSQLHVLRSNKGLGVDQPFRIPSDED